MYVFVIMYPAVYNTQCAKMKNNIVHHKINVNKKQKLHISKIELKSPQNRYENLGNILFLCTVTVSAVAALNMYLVLQQQ